ncbi:hypothetical protein RBU61_18335 [Tissierella sp. MB52-C2]|uniref:hypothetical protein n=1 Tax=Tissierella sp. MB52-C2 TaxID=3070999 RepID=UPI00280AC46F|nr:hypothetical protein [Tissierella sp. MB52-C2]WMM24861.1 hypothetical protein RBU61_18335 [Tissierella sp. MB52-C2]
MYIGELSTLIKNNSLEDYTIEEFSKFLKEEETIKKYSLNNYKNTEIQLVDFKLVKDLDDFRIIITYHLINLDDETCQGILSYSKEYFLRELEKSLDIKSVIITKFQNWIEKQSNLKKHLIDGLKRYYENWMIDCKDEYEEKMGGICIDELNYKLGNIAYLESYFMYQDGYQDTFIVKLDVYSKDRLLNSYYMEFSIDGEVLDDWMD